MTLIPLRTALAASQLSSVQVQAQAPVKCIEAAGVPVDAPSWDLTVSDGSNNEGYTYLTLDRELKEYKQLPVQAPPEIDFSVTINIKEGANPPSWTLTLSNKQRNGQPAPISTNDFIYTTYYGPRDRPAYIKYWHLNNLDSCTITMHDKLPYEKYYISAALSRTN